MKTSLWLSSLLCVLLIAIDMPPLLYLFYPVWPVIFIFMVFMLDASKYVWLWIWGLGLILDVMQHNVLGTHVISMGLVTILLLRYFHHKDNMSVLDGIILMGCALVIYLLTMMYIEGVACSLYQCLLVLGQVTSSIALWPCLHVWLLKPKKTYQHII